MSAFFFFFFLVPHSLKPFLDFSISSEPPHQVATTEQATKVTRERERGRVSEMERVG